MKQNKHFLSTYSIHYPKILQQKVFVYLTESEKQVAWKSSFIVVFVYNIQN